MAFRITTNMMRNTYRYNLQNNTKKLSDATDMVLTHRKYNSYAEDPAAATQEFRLRRDYYQTFSQLNNTKNAYSKYNTAWHNLAGVKKDLIDKTAIEAAIRGENGGTGEARHALATVLRETSESVIHALNQKLGDQFIFAGNDGLNVPFEWRGEDLYYRGINVKAGSLEKPTAEEGTWLANAKATLEAANGGKLTEDDQAWYDYYTHASSDKPKTTEPGWLETELNNDANLSPTEKEGWLAYYRHEGLDEKPTADVPDWAKDPTTTFDEYGMPKGEKVPEYATAGEMDKAWLDYYKDQADLAKLKKMSGEELYLDLGMGLAEKKPNDPINGSYFNSALCGIDFTGFGADRGEGTDNTGDPQNLALIMRELADVFDAWDETMEPQGYNPALAKNSAAGLTSKELEDKANRLLNKLQASQDNFSEKYSELDAKSVFLTSNQERLETQLTDTNTQLLDVYQVNMADAITGLSWQQYCYNAALKIGNQLLSQSLIDYMN